MNIFHRHKWSDWLVTDHGKTFHYAQAVGWYVVQKRHCHQCGKTAVKEQAKYGGNPSSYCQRVSEMVARAPRKDGISA